MNVAVFSDIHGRLALCFKLCARWEVETGEKIHLILQAGDLGAFPDKSKLDRATLKYAKRDPTELGFANDFAVYYGKIAELLQHTSAPMIFVRGNHEDHDWLDQLEQNSTEPIFAIDAYERVFCIKTGYPFTWTEGDEHITLLGIGRIGALGNSNIAKPSNIQDYEVKQLNSLTNPSVDILLTHDSAYGFVTPGFGMKEIREALNRHQPIYHFYGHTGRKCNQRLDENGMTLSCKMSDLHWTRSKTLEPGAIGILRWHNREEHQYEVVSESWLNEYTAYNWEYL